MKKAAAEESKQRIDWDEVRRYLEHLRKTAWKPGQPRKTKP